MSRPIVSKLWIAAAERALDAELQDVPQESVAEVRAHLRVAAITAEDLLNVAAGPRGAARCVAIARLVERFGDQALDGNYIGAAFIGEAVARALVSRSTAPVDDAGTDERYQTGTSAAQRASGRVTSRVPQPADLQVHSRRS